MGLEDRVSILATLYSLTLNLMTTANHRWHLSWHIDEGLFSETVSFFGFMLVTGKITDEKLSRYSESNKIPETSETDPKRLVAIRRSQATWRLDRLRRRVNALENYT